MMDKTQFPPGAKSALAAMFVLFGLMAITVASFFDWRDSLEITPSILYSEQQVKIELRDQLLEIKSAGLALVALGRQASGASLYVRSLDSNPYGVFWDHRRGKSQERSFQSLEVRSGRIKHIIYTIAGDRISQRVQADIELPRDAVGRELEFQLSGSQARIGIDGVFAWTPPAVSGDAYDAHLRRRDGSGFGIVVPHGGGRFLIRLMEGSYGG